MNASSASNALNEDTDENAEIESLIIEINDDIPLEELLKRTPAVHTVSTSNSFQPQSRPSTSTAPIEPSCPLCQTHQEHAQEAYKSMMSLSKQVQLLRTVSMQKAQLERINQEQQTYLASQRERTVQLERRLEEREQLIRDLKMQIERIRGQNQQVLDSSKLAIKDFKKSAEDWEARYIEARNQLQTATDECLVRRDKFIQSVKFAEIAVEKMEQAQRASKNFECELQRHRLEREAEQLCESTFVLEMRSLDKLESAKSPGKRTPSRRRTTTSGSRAESAYGSPKNLSKALQSPAKEPQSFNMRLRSRDQKSIDMTDPS